MSDDNSHRGFFAKKRLVGRIETEEDRQRLIAAGAANQVKREQYMAQVLSSPRQEPGAGSYVKVSFDEFNTMFKEYTDAYAQGRAKECAFQPFSAYATLITHYADGRPRDNPVRPFALNEVGMYRGKIVVLKDAGPGDKGEGKEHQVHPNTPVGEKDNNDVLEGIQGPDDAAVDDGDTDDGGGSHE